MRKVSLRSSFALIMALLVIFGMLIYIARFVKDGEKWALYFDESMSSCVYTVLDKNGIQLAKMGGGGKFYAEDDKTRLSCYHVTGDFNGNVGTGVLSSFQRELSGYNIFTGVKQNESMTLNLSIDSELQKLAYDALDGRKGAVLLSNYKTGELICMVSAPAIDPMNPPKELPDGAYINRCISSSFTPGSVFKLVTVCAAIENIDDLFDRSFTCRGSISVMGSVITCTGNHGEQSIEQALANSCNCAFGNIALELGADTLAEYAAKLGVTSSHELDGIKTAAGSFEKDSSKSAALAWSGIGQYNDLLSPYALLRIVSAVGNGGIIKEPSMLGTQSKSTQLIDQATAQKMSSMMNYNVAYHYGRDRFPGLNISAKTGTAEVGNGKQSHGWFAGFLEDNEHPYAFVVFVENGGSGINSAGGVANKLLQAAVKK